MSEPDIHAEALEQESAPRWPLVAAALLLIALGLVPTANRLTAGAAHPQWGRHVRQWSAWLVISPLLALALAPGGIAVRFEPYRAAASASASSTGP